MIGFFLALPLAALAAWRAGLISWWAAVIGGIIAGFGALGATISGGVVLTAGSAVFSVALARIDRRVWDSAVPAEDAPRER